MRGGTFISNLNLRLENPATERKRTRVAIAMGFPMPHPLADLDKDIAAIIAKIGPSAFEVAYDSGREMTLDEAVALARGERKQV